MLLSEITPTWLRNTFLFGIELVDGNGNQMSDDTLQFYIDAAIDLAEKLLDISVHYLQDVSEDHDSRYNERIRGWGFIQLYKKPIITIKKVVLNYGGKDLFEFPLEWIKYNKIKGQIQSVPFYGVSHLPMITSAGSVFYPSLTYYSYVPQIIRVTYDAGYQDTDEIPDLLARLIGMLSAISILDVGGDIVLGMPALAGYSISMDGLSQTVQTTNSATSAAYRGRIENYRKQIEKDILPALRSYYGGIKITGA